MADFQWEYANLKSYMQENGSEPVNEPPVDEEWCPESVSDDEFFALQERVKRRLDVSEENIWEADARQPSGERLRALSALRDKLDEKLDALKREVDSRDGKHGAKTELEKGKADELAAILRHQIESLIEKPNPAACSSPHPGEATHLVETTTDMPIKKAATGKNGPVTCRKLTPEELAELKATHQ